MTQRPFIAFLNLIASFAFGALGALQRNQIAAAD